MPEQTQKKIAIGVTAAVICAFLVSLGVTSPQTKCPPQPAIAVAPHQKNARKKIPADLPRLSSLTTPPAQVPDGEGPPSTEPVQKSALTATQREIVDAASSPQNIFWSPADRAAEVAERHDGIATLVYFLHHPEISTSSGTDEGEDFDTRLKTMDTLEAVAMSAVEPKKREEAITGLKSVFNAPVSPGLRIEEKKVLIATKKDALTSLIRIDPLRGLSTFAGVKDATQRAFLSHGVLLALIDLGMSREEAAAYLGEFSG